MFHLYIFLSALYWIHLKGTIGTGGKSLVGPKLSQSLHKAYQILHYFESSPQPEEIKDFSLVDRVHVKEWIMI